MTQNNNKKTINKLYIIGAILLVISVFRYFELSQYLTLSYIKESQQEFHALYSLPGAAVLTLAAGGLFGLTVGTVAVSFASTLGATLACLVSRFLLREWVQNKIGDKLSAINKGIEQEGAFYLFSLRLVPVFPFFVINLLMGLTRIRLFTFYWVSQVGMLAGILVYVNAGKELAKIDSLAGIMSPGALASFAVLGLFPITVKKLLVFFKKQFQATLANKNI